MDNRLTPTSYNVKGFTDRVSIESRGRGTWTVTTGTACLNRDMQFECEGFPSSRTDEYIERTRLSSLELALERLDQFAQWCRSTDPHSRFMNKFGECPTCNVTTKEV